MHGYVTKDKPSPSPGLCFPPHKRRTQGPHPALPSSDPLRAKDLLGISEVSRGFRCTNVITLVTVRMGSQIPCVFP